MRRRGRSPARGARRSSACSDATAEGDGWEACTSPERYALADDATGDYSFAVRATDRAGNTGPSASSDYRLLPKAPAAARRRPCPGGERPERALPPRPRPRTTTNRPHRRAAKPAAPGRARPRPAPSAAPATTGRTPRASDGPAERDRGAAPARSRRPDAGAAASPSAGTP